MSVAMNATPSSLRSFRKAYSADRAALSGPDSPTAITTIISLPSLERAAPSSVGGAERPRVWIFLLAFSSALMLVVWSLFSGPGDTNKAPLFAPATPGQATPQEAPLATLSIEAEPADARIQVASVSLGTTVTEIGRISVGVPEGEAIAITVSLDGYQTVQTSIPSTNGRHIVQLKPISEQPSAPQRTAKKAAGASKSPQSTPDPNDCLD
jgi:hypothetical protein